MLLSKDQFDSVTLVTGGSSTRTSRGGSMCVMQLVSWMIGDEHSYLNISTVCPMVAQAMVALNDLSSGPFKRVALKPLTHRVLFSKSEDPKVYSKRHDLWAAYLKKTQARNNIRPPVDSREPDVTACLRADIHLYPRDAVSLILSMLAVRSEQYKLLLPAPVEVSNPADVLMVEELMAERELVAEGAEG